MSATYYYKFDFEQGVVIEYARSGECCECGACCKTVIKWQGTNRPNDLIKWNNGNGDVGISEMKGVWTAVYVNDRWRYFKDLEITDQESICSYLTADNRCKVHIGKRLISREWPMSPDHVTPFKECTYTFEEIKRWSIEEYFRG